MLAGDSRFCRALELFFAVPGSGVCEGLKVSSVPRFNRHPLCHRDRCSWTITVAELNGHSKGREPYELLRI